MDAVRGAAATLTGRTLGLAIALVAGWATSDVSLAAPAVEPPRIAIRFYDDNRLAQGAALSATAQSELERAAGLALVALGRDADGAFRFAAASTVSDAALRQALHRIRATGAVVYAELAGDTPPNAAAALPSEPVSSFIVAMRPLPKSDAKARTESLRMRIVQKSGVGVAGLRTLADGSQLVVLDSAVSPERARQTMIAIASDPAVRHVEADRRATITALPADPLFSQQWNLIDAAGGINALRAWDFATGDPGIPIAILDTGVLPHPDLLGRVRAGYDFVSDPRLSNDGDGRDPDPSDPGDWVSVAESTTPGSALWGCSVANSSWHGTMVAGTLGAVANNGDGVSGINWRSPLISVRVLGKCGGALSDIAEGIRWAAGLPVPGVPANPLPARVINLSMAGSGACGPTLQAAVTEAIAHGAILVAAAGNAGDDVDHHWPANCHGVIAVAATARDGSLGFYSSRGARVALSAPGGGVGGNIPTLRNTGLTAPDPHGFGYDYQLGTSLAAPHVSATISLALAIDPDLTAAEARALIESTARPFPAVASGQCSASMCGAGLLDAAWSLAKLAGGPGAVDVPSAMTPPPVIAPPTASLPQPPPPVSQPIVDAQPAPPGEIPSASPVPLPGGWQSKPRELRERLIKQSGSDAPTRPTRMSRTVER